MCNKAADGTCKTPIRPVRFGNFLVKNLIDGQPPLVFSPFSAELVTAMVCAGVGGEMGMSLKNHLGIKEIKVAADMYKNHLLALRKITTTDVISVNKIYIRPGLEIKLGFLDVVKKFLAEVEEVAFLEDSTVPAINGWVSEMTNDKITGLVGRGEFDDTTQMVVLNAVYFRGAWEVKFNPDDTAERSFYLADGSEKKVEMMHVTDEFSLGENKELGVEILELPYQGGELAMLILLPTKNEGIIQLKHRVEKFDVSKMKLRNKVKVLVKIPKFTIETEVDLKNVLTDLGMGEIFRESADFSNMTDAKQIYVSKMVQKVFIEVNEEGTEAAAATGANIVLLSMPKPPEKEFVADHEFVFVITHKETILFVGAFS